MAVFTVALVRKIPRSQGAPPAFVTKIVRSEPAAMGLYHLAYFLHALCVVHILPNRVKSIIFSSAGVTALGTLFPIVASIEAACTDIETDNTAWLQYWIMHGAFSYATGFVDNLTVKYPRFFRHWWEIEFYMILWLILPFTDGATVLYDRFTEPVLVPILRPIKKKCEGWLTTVALAAVNASHLWFVGMVFMALPTVLKRAAVIGVGTIYPVLASIVSIADGDVTRWLIYWSCFSILFLIMLGVEKSIGPMPGLYVLGLAAVIYLMLPIFNGSDAVFRNILVPLFQQREALIVKDARALAKSLSKQLPANRHEEARKAAAAAFMEEATKSSSGGLGS